MPIMYHPYSSGPRIRRALIHRYDNEPDILAVEQRGYSDVYSRVARDDFDIVVVVPTTTARTEIAVVADAISPQYMPDGGEPWPGRHDRYRYRVHVENVRFTTRAKVRDVVRGAGATWAAQWTVLSIDLDENLLYDVTPAAGERSSIGEPTVAYLATLPDELPSSDMYPEGAVRQILVNAYERSEEARARCVAHWGVRCVVCGLDFGEKYGEEARGYIHVHHLRSLSGIGNEYMVDPVADMRPLCPNCHAVVHIGGRTRSIEELESMLR